MPCFANMGPINPRGRGELVPSQKASEIQSVAYLVAVEVGFENPPLLMAIVFLASQLARAAGLSFLARDAR